MLRGRPVGRERRRRGREACPCVPCAAPPSPAQSSLFVLTPERLSSPARPVGALRRRSAAWRQIAQCGHHFPHDTACPHRFLDGSCPLCGWRSTTTAAKRARSASAASTCPMPPSIRGQTCRGRRRGAASTSACRPGNWDRALRPSSRLEGSAALPAFGASGQPAGRHACARRRLPLVLAVSARCWHASSGTSDS